MIVHSDLVNISRSHLAAGAILWSCLGFHPTRSLMVVASQHSVASAAIMLLTSTELEISKFCYSAVSQISVPARIPDVAAAANDHDLNQMNQMLVMNRGSYLGGCTLSGTVIAVGMLFCQLRHVLVPDASNLILRIVLVSC